MTSPCVVTYPRLTPTRGPITQSRGLDRVDAPPLPARSLANDESGSLDEGNEPNCSPASFMPVAAPFCASVASPCPVRQVTRTQPLKRSRRPMSRRAENDQQPRSSGRSDARAHRIAPPDTGTLIGTVIAPLE